MIYSEFVPWAHSSPWLTSGSVALASLMWFQIKSILFATNRLTSFFFVVVMCGLNIPSCGSKSMRCCEYPLLSGDFLYFCNPVISDAHWNKTWSGGWNTDIVWWRGSGTGVLCSGSFGCFDISGVRHEFVEALIVFSTQLRADERLPTAAVLVNFSYTEMPGISIGILRNVFYTDRWTFAGTNVKICRGPTASCW